MRWSLALTSFIVAYTCSCCMIYTEDLLLPAPPDAAPMADAGSDRPPVGAAVLYSTSFEAGDPLFELVEGSGDLTTIPPPGTAAQTGERVLSSTVLSSAFEDRDIRSGCVSLGSDDPIAVDAWATAGPNDGNTIRGRLAVLWYAGPSCEVLIGPAVDGVEVPLPEGTYTLVPLDAEPPETAVAFQLRFDVRDELGASASQLWAADDVEVRQ
jgi:hypothetical protein